MQYKPAIWSLILSLLASSSLSAQSVLYSSTTNNDLNTRFEVIGKAGDFYWIYKSKKNSYYRNGSFTWPPEKDITFTVYDRRLHLVKEISNDLGDTVLKHYLITQKHCFDQLVFSKLGGRTSVAVNRFTQDGGEWVTNGHLHDFPGGMSPEDFVVTRSPDRSKILLLGFVPTGITPELYARVYTKDWRLLNETIYKDGNVIQPVIQYDFTNYLLEAAETSPIKITNSGDWLMIAPARRKNSFLLSHFKSSDSSFKQTDIMQLQGQGVENFSLCVEGTAAYIGILENLTTSDKKVRMMQYNLAESRLAYDTTYQFVVPNLSKRKEHYLFEQDFVQIPGKGFMYMKEYGRRYFIDNSGEAVSLEDEQVYAAHGSYKAKLKLNRKEYTRSNTLFENRKEYDRGDLSLRYFPFQPADSCWGGLLHVEQNTELTYSYLSYACIPSKDKIIFLYNVLANNENKFSSTTILDHKGQAMDEGLIFWRSTNVLDFQKARLIDTEELFVPFERNRMHGFAIIRL